MKKILLLVAMGSLLALPVFGGTILYNNLTPNSLLGMSSSVQAGSKSTEAGDDFVLNQRSTITGASFVGLMPASASTLDVTVEIYRVFPQDSTFPPSGTVPTRANSPSDNEFTDRNSGAAELTFTTSVLNSSFTVSNSVLAGDVAFGTGGDGAFTGQEVEFDVTFSDPISLNAGHYFFVPQLDLGGSDFLWLSAARPITGPGTTPISPDLQVWMRDGSLDPNWLRVGTDIVGGNNTVKPTFNAAFQLVGTVPEPGTLLLVLTGAVGILGTHRKRRPR